MRADEAFLALLNSPDPDRLDREEGTTFGIYADGRLALTNDAWDRFAEENGDPDLPERWPLGRNVFEAIPPDLVDFYREGWEWVVESGRPWSHTYECSSVREYRRLRMTCYPVGGGDEAPAAGVLVVNVPVAVREWSDGEASTEPREEYVAPDGTMAQCSHCRRTRHGSGRWDWVPEWVNRWPPEARPTLCDFCIGYHYYDSHRGAPAGR